MTTSKTPGVPPTPPADEELEGRLHASWDRAIARAEDDLSRGDLVPSALAAGRRRQPWRVVARVALGAAAVMVLGVASIVGSGARRDSMEPPASPAAPIASPIATPYLSGSPASGSQAPETSASPGDGVGIPVLDAGVTFPPTVDGEPVVTVGPDADARIAAATDDSPIYVSGWILGPGRRVCNDFDPGSPAPNGIMWKDCTAIPLRATEDGGATLRVFAAIYDASRSPRLPDITHVMPVLMRVHAHDAGCAADDCAHKPVLDSVVQYGAPLMAPVLRTTTRPSDGITMERAVAAADAYVTETQLAYGLPLVLLSAEAGPRALVGQGGSMSDLGWVWAARYVTENGRLECWVYVGYVDGIATEASSESIRFP